MFRFMRPRRSILSMSRLPLSVEARAQRGQATNVQKVYFRKPGMRPRNFVLSVLTIYVGFSVYSKVVLDPLDRAAQEALKDIPESELEEEESKPFFIPFPGTTKQLPQQPYRGADPEWQEFMKFSKDQARAKKVRSDLANFVRAVADKHPILALRCGTGMKLRRFWLDIDFPTHAPPEFVRSGLEITDDYIAWSEMPVDSLTVFKIRRVLWPSALVWSFWTLVKTMVSDDYKRLTGVLKSEPSPSHLEQIIARHRQISNTQAASGGSIAQPQTVTDAAKAVPTDTTGGRAAASGKESGDLEGITVPDSAIAAHARLNRAIAAFKAKLWQSWRPAPNYPPRGSIIVSGFVELESPKAYLVFDIKAAWDPKTREFDRRSMHMSLRRMQMKQQAPAKVT